MKKPEAHPIIPGIDYELGLSYSQTPEILNALLREFHADIPKRSAALEKAFIEEDLVQYEREVHSLKSCARLIGAKALSRMAAEHESYAALGNKGAIRLRLPTLLESYRSYSDSLAPFAKETKLPTETLDENERRALLEELLGLLDNFDLDGAQRIVERLRGSLLPEAYMELYQALFEAVDDVEYDTAGEIAKALLTK